MEHWEKIVEKLSGKEQRSVEKALRKLKSDSNSLHVKKLRGEEQLRIRVGRYRILIHFENNVPVIDDIRKRDENTYKNL